MVALEPADTATDEVTVEQLIQRLAINRATQAEVAARIKEATASLMEEADALSHKDAELRDQLQIWMLAAGDKTKVGSGLEVRRVERADLKIFDEGMLANFLLTNGLLWECSKVAIDPTKIKFRLKAGDSLPGARMQMAVRIEVREVAPSSIESNDEPETAF